MIQDLRYLNLIFILQKKISFHIEFVNSFFHHCDDVIPLSFVIQFFLWQFNFAVPLWVKFFPPSEYLWDIFFIFDYATTMCLSIYLTSGLFSDLCYYNASYMIFFFGGAMLSFPLGYYLKVDLLGQFTWKIIHQTFFKFDQK